MSKFFRSVKFAWEYFILGQHQVESKYPSDAFVEREWIENPLVGKYVQTSINTWWADILLSDLEYEVRLCGHGVEPTSDQIDAIVNLIKRLPHLTRASKLDAPPKNDGWGNTPPLFDIVTAKVDSITIKDDGVFFVLFEIDPDGPYMVAPAFEVSKEFNLLSAEWTI